MLYIFPLLYSFVCISKASKHLAAPLKMSNRAVSNSGSGHRAIRTIAWFRNDLRVHDNQLLTQALSRATTGANMQSTAPSDILCVYCFDPRHYGMTSYNSLKTGSWYRAQFLIESVDNLRANLRALGLPLLVAFDTPERVIPRCLSGCNGGTVLVQGEIGTEEKAVEQRVQLALESLLPPNAKGDAINQNNKRTQESIKSVGQASSLFKLERINGYKTLYHPEDLPYWASGFSTFPTTFTVFREKAEKTCTVRSMIGSPSPLSAANRQSADSTAHSVVENVIVNGIQHCGLNYLPTLTQLGLSSSCASHNKDQTTGLKSSGSIDDEKFVGGETAALHRLQTWAFDEDRLKDYFDTRNGMLGTTYSSRLSPYLAHGCISPRYCYQNTLIDFNNI